METYYFAGENCKPCKECQPLIKKLQDDGIKITKYIVEYDYLKAAEFCITSIPTFVKLIDHIEVDRITGMISEAELREFAS